MVFLEVIHWSARTDSIEFIISCLFSRQTSKIMDWIKFIWLKINYVHFKVYTYRVALFQLQNVLNISYSNSRVMIIFISNCIYFKVWTRKIVDFRWVHTCLNCVMSVKLLYVSMGSSVCVCEFVSPNFNLLLRILISPDYKYKQNEKLYRQHQTFYTKTHRQSRIFPGIYH